MKKKSKTNLIMKKIVALFCLLIAMVIICACSSETVIPEKPDPATEDAVDYVQDFAESETEETEPQMLGSYTLEDLSDTDGFFVKYSDGSFDRYYKGTVVNWGMSKYYAYGTEWYPANVVLDEEDDALNMERMKEGVLVFKTSNTSKVDAGIYPVIESGFAMSGNNTSGYTETLLWFDEKGNDCWVVDGTKIGPEYQWSFSKLRDIISINGIDYGSAPIFEKEEDKTYVTLQLGDTYVIGEADGTALIELEYIVDKKYYLSTLNFFEKAYEYVGDYYPLELQPTTDGYAVVDLTDIPAGDYTVTYSYWNEDSNKRQAYITHICIE